MDKPQWAKAGVTTRPGPRRQRIDLTRGAIVPKLAALAGPLVAGNILQTVYNLVDMFWVGWLGAEAVAAVSIVFPTQWLLISMAMGVTIAGAALVSQWTGADQPEQAAFAAAQTLVLAGAVSTLLATIAYLGRFALLDLLGATDALFEPTLAYVSIIFWSVPFTFIFFAFRSALRGVGDTVRPMYLAIGSNVFNMVLDPLLILGIGPFPALGVAGAAWATLISRALVAGIGIWLLFGGRIALTLKVKQLVPDWSTIAQLLRVGVPGGLDGAARSFAAVAIVAMVTRFGPEATAAYGIGIRVMSLVWTVSGAVGQAVAAGVGQNLGANELRRAARVAWSGMLGTFLVVGLAGVSAALLAPVIVGVFVSNPEAIAEGTRFLRISGWGFGFGGALMVIQGAFHGAGRTGYSMTLSVLNRWLLRMPIAILLAWSLNLGARGLWWSFLISDVTAFLIGTVWLQRGLGQSGCNVDGGNSVL
jgi:putative MATE family efflux protein